MDTWLTYRHIGIRKMRESSSLSVIIAISILLVLLTGLNFACNISPEQPPATSAPTTPINVDLNIAKAPRLNEIVALSCVVWSDLDGPASTASIELPEGAVLVDGNLKWEGDLQKDIPVQFSATIKFVEEGQWEIKAVANRVVSESYRWGDADYIYLTVKKDSGSFSFDTNTSEPVVELEPESQTQPDKTPQRWLPDPKGETLVPPSE